MPPSNQMSPKRPFSVRRDGWSSAQLLADVRNLDRLPTDREDYEPILWNDLCSEHDSGAMYQRLSTSPVVENRGAQAVLDAWIADEQNHAAGFEKLYRLIYGATEAEVERRLAARVSDFEPIEAWLSDPVAIWLLFAFDEIATFKSYVEDFAFYDAFDVPALSTWIRRVARDEGLHFTNFVNLVRAEPSAEPKNCARVIDEILEFDRQARDYGATFVLDHTGSQFTDAFLEDCAKAVKRAVGS